MTPTTLTVSMATLSSKKQVFFGRPGQFPYNCSRCCGVTPRNRNHRNGQLAANETRWPRRPRRKGKGEMRYRSLTMVLLTTCGLFTSWQTRLIAVEPPAAAEAALRNASFDEVEIEAIDLAADEFADVEIEEIDFPADPPEKAGAAKAGDKKGGKAGENEKPAAGQECAACKDDRRFGTVVRFAESAEAAATEAKESSKLVFAMHISGNLEQEKFT